MSRQMLPSITPLGLKMVRELRCVGLGLRGAMWGLYKLKGMGLYTLRGLECEDEDLGT